jgi:hypothetical protein
MRLIQAIEHSDGKRELKYELTRPDDSFAVVRQVTDEQFEQILEMTLDEVYKLIDNILKYKELEINK